MYDLVIIHFHPLELYPPAMNMLNSFGEKSEQKTLVITHATNKIENNYSHPGIFVRRFAPVESSSTLTRQNKYFLFILKTFLLLLKNKPKTIFYYETNSALPVYLYLIFTCFKKTDLYIHYHEYNSPDQYKTNMKFVYLSYLVEKKWLWKKAAWISHTNIHRAELFKNDYPYVNDISVLPNYPPKAWLRNNKANSSTLSLPVNLVYIGSLSLENFHLQTLCNWIINNKGKVTLSIFTHNYSEKAKNYLDTLNSKFINVSYQGIWYFDLPKVLKSFDVGLVLYNGFSKNYIYNETNKLFEYLACGLDVWFSEETKGIYKHITESIWPKVVKLDYNQLNQYSIEKLIDHEGLTYKPSKYCCEELYELFLENLIVGS